MFWYGFRGKTPLARIKQKDDRIDSNLKNALVEIKNKKVSQEKNS